MGKTGFQWFVGVVEDRNDPQKVGRVRVRCLGYHTPDKGKLPTADLPWAHVMNPIINGIMLFQRDINQGVREFARQENFLIIN